MICARWLLFTLILIFHKMGTQTDPCFVGKIIVSQFNQNEAYVLVNGALIQRINLLNTPTAKLSINAWLRNDERRNKLRRPRG